MKISNEKEMKKSYMVGFVLTFGILLTSSGQDVSKKEQINAMKIAFITKKIGLTPGEAEKFWPVYNEYDQKKEEIHSSKRSIGWYYVQNQTKLSDQEAADLLEKYVTAQEEEGKLYREYSDKFKKILPPRKVLELFIAEYQFKSHLLKELKENKGNRR